MSSESVFVSVVYTGLNSDGAECTYTFMLMAPMISRKLSFWGSDLRMSKSRFSISFESIGCFRRE